MAANRAEKYEFEQKVIEFVKTRPAVWKTITPIIPMQYSLPTPGTTFTIRLNQRTLQPIVIIFYYILRKNIKLIVVFPKFQVSTSGAGVAAHCKHLWTQFMSYKRNSKGTTGQKGGRRPNFRHAESKMYFNDPDGLENSNYSNAEGNKEFDDGDEPEDRCGDDGASMTNSNESSSQVVVTATNVDLPIPTSKAHVTKKSKLDPFAEHLLEVVKGQELNEFQHFGQFVAIKLQYISEIDRKRACRLQNDIHNLVFDAEMDILM